jgi:acetoin utilization protein AcuB
MKSIPQISRYMTTCPHSIRIDSTLEHALGMMKEYNFRHLPVLDGGKLVGVITDRDIKNVLSLDGANPKEVLVSDAHTEEAFSVSPEAPLDVVCEQMAKDKIGSALVVDNKKLVGIFTWVDALNATNSLLHTRLK